MTESIRLRARAADRATTSVASWQPIFDGILDAIVRHRLEPGARLGEEEVAEIYGVSRTVVRAALQALACDEVVVIERNKGARVAQPTPAEAREIFEARAVIEPEIARLAAARMDVVAVSRLHETIAAEHRALHADKPLEAVFHSAEFHRIIAGLARQRVLADILGELLSRSSLVIALYWRQPDALCDNHAHLALVETLERGDGEEAGSLMREHVMALLDGLDLPHVSGTDSNLAAVLKSRV